MAKLSGKTKRTLRKLRTELIDWYNSPFLARSNKPEDKKRQKELDEYIEALNDALK